MKVLMVCLGNICRSPLAEGILQHLSDKHQLGWSVDSAGTSGWHNGGLPDSRSIDVAALHGIDITHQRSRKFLIEDFDAFDLIYVMDSSNYTNVTKLARNQGDKDKVELILNLSQPGMNNAVPDPYYEGGFEGVFQMINEACKVMIQKYAMAKLDC